MLESPINARCRRSWPSGYFIVLFSLSEEIHQWLPHREVSEMSERTEHPCESENFKIRLQCWIKTNATCHGLGINFSFYSFFICSTNAYLLTGAPLALCAEDLKLNKTWRLPQAACTRSKGIEMLENQIVGIVPQLCKYTKLY